ncbi:winged helix-turn-helix transcriptional regulator [Azospirillum sp. RWY-5-1]|uniref:Winged helix-turn-helix transcriptional regulator n=1 Tax=Azospirillum oleiclasticum TaxID=2735135 RepID=A0ABX2T3U1_9PROT|nr:winged helix-turn-helix domain-containing protein [Azospirillum oleiclasticum]NYZ11650.1 winged helix-turn-helix transcriptional regulator [Azospirillum oleiclasticum]NYZ18811.1 winged helix-turn-helix transcriptional regulator [Azospirillum oleiclasticum]
MSMDRRALIEALDEIARGDATPQDAAVTVRDAFLAFDGAGSLGEHVYAALRDMTWHTLTSRAYTDDLAGWFDVVGHAAALAVHAGEHEVARRLRVLGDLIGQSARFVELQPSDEILDRKHVVRILRLLRKEGDPVPRARLAAETGLANANLSRVLAMLGSHGLVQRRSAGKEALFTITQAGVAALERREGEGGHQEVTRVDPWEHAPVAIGIWEPQGALASHSKAMTEFFDPLNPQPDFRSWQTYLGETARAERRGGSELVREFDLGKGRWIECREAVSETGQRIVVVHDITTHKARERALKNEREALLAREAKQRAALAAAEAQLHAFRSIHGGLREELVETTISMSQNLRSCIRMAAHNPPPMYATLLDLDKHLRALQVAGKNIYSLPVPLGERPPLEIRDPHQMIGETIDVVNTLSESKITLDYGKIDRIRISATIVQSALGQILLALLRNRDAGYAYRLHASVEQKFLVVSLAPTSGPAEGTADWVPTGRASPFRSTTSEFQCWGAVGELGGYFDVQPGDGDEVVRLSFPCEPA